jgi:imidazolonepropionase-like amidohydrolase
MQYFTPAIFVTAFFLQAEAQQTFPTNGAPFNPHTTYAFVNANIQADPSTLLKSATLIIRDEKILGIGNGINVPANAVKFDLRGKYIYPSFIELFSDYGIMPDRFPRKASPGPQMESNQKGAYGWNQAVRPYLEAHKLFAHQKERASELKKAGFGITLSHNRDGIIRGTGPLVHLNTGRENNSVISDRCAAFMSFQKGSSTQDYPSSLTGAIALIRQTYYDADWYATAKDKTEYNISLDYFNRNKTLPVIFEAGDKYNVLRAAKIAREFGAEYILRSSGNEYQRLREISESKVKLIVPIDFPEAYDVEDPFDAEVVSLAELKHWEMAPANPAMLEKAGIEFCITSSGMKEKKNFLGNLRKAVQYGLSRKMALSALTVNPASTLGQSKQLGMLKAGYYADFFISDRPIFEENAQVLQHWVAGDPETFEDPLGVDLRGSYILNAGKKQYRVKLSGEPLRPKGEITVDTSKKAFQYALSGRLISFSFMLDSSQFVRCSGTFDPERKFSEGKGQWPDGNWSDYRLSLDAVADTSTKAAAIKTVNPGPVIYPFGAYGIAVPGDNASFAANFRKAKQGGDILIKGATVWTNKHDSALQNYDVLLVSGKVAKMDRNITPPAGVKIIEARGRHLTPGIIDEHSHIALSGGVNEGTQASSAEVRMGDVINPEDINIYRQLSGGVTTSQLLHGSANPIGGQSAIIKLRWGLGPEEMKFANAAPFIKFALGENVKQSNWGDLQTVRFPQTRMGVEQVYADYFIRAKAYDKQLGNAAVNAAFPRPGRDLELDAIAEILNKKRYITCHSYVQSEINMLMKLGDSLGFRVNTFTHILEGYKVADKMKSHGANASTFSDWWAYKNEVMDAIPYNAALLTRMGINTAINSDDAEMARRLNQEAAKSIKYGGLTEIESLKMVTLNPARMLHIDHEVGTIESGKSADLVLWSDNPMSVYAKADITLIDGVIYFDREQDAILRDEIRKERARITGKLIAEKSKGTKTVKPQPKRPRLYHCDTIGDD